MEMARLALFICLFAVLEAQVTKNVLTNDIKGMSNIQEVQATANTSFTKSLPRNDLNEISEFRTTATSVLSSKSPTQTPILQERDKTPEDKKHLSGVAELGKPYAPLVEKNLCCCLMVRVLLNLFFHWD